MSLYLYRVLCVFENKAKSKELDGNNFHNWQDSPYLGVKWGIGIGCMKGYLILGMGILNNCLPY